MFMDLDQIAAIDSLSHACFLWGGGVSHSDWPITFEEIDKKIWGKNLWSPNVNKSPQIPGSAPGFR